MISKPDGSSYVVFTEKKLVAGTNIGGTYIQLPFMSLIVKRPQGVVLGAGKNETSPNLLLSNNSIRFNENGDSMQIILDRSK